MLFDRNLPEFHLSLGYIIPGTLITAAFFTFVVGAGLRAQSLPVRVGQETLIGRIATANSRIGPKPGHIMLDGEDWAATCETPIQKGQSVEIVGRDGLLFIVKPTDKENSP